MPSNKKGNRGGNNNDDDDLKQEGNVKVQAVLLADSVFGSKVTKREDYQSFGLRPWSSEASTSSPILCRINNVPLIDYILDFLAGNGVEQVIVVTGSETDLEEKIKQHQTSKGHSGGGSSSSGSGLELLFLKDTSLTNAGDALRELYKRNWIRASKQALPFLLVGGDVVADLDLREAMRAHKERHSHDSAAVMTVVLKPVQSSSNKSTRSTRSTTSSTTSTPSIVPRASNLVVGLVGAASKTIATADAQGASDSSSPSPGNSSDYRVLYYDNGRSPGATLPCSFLTQSQTQSMGPSHCGGLVVRHDLLDTGIAICSPDVLGRLEDEFDYLDLSHDFVTNSVAEEEDGLQTRIYAHVLESTNNDKSGAVTRSFAARAVDFSTYHAISRDLLQRWAYPTVADRMLASGKRYKLVKCADHNHHNRRSNNNHHHHHRTKQQQPLRSLDNHPTGSGTGGSGSETSKSSSSSSSSSGSFNNNQYQYKEVLNPTRVGRTSKVIGPGMMGSLGSVGEGCLLARCVVGDNVTIEDHSKLSDCHVMDGVTVGSNVVLDSCVVAANASVRSGATLGKGCYVGEGCVIGEGITLQPNTRVTLAKDDDDDDWGDDSDGDDGFSDTDDDDGDDGDDSSESSNADMGRAISSSGVDCDRHLVGPDGRGKLWKPALDEDDFSDEEEDGSDPLETLLQLQSIGGDPTSYYQREEKRNRAREAEEFEDDGFSDHEDEGEDDEMAAENQAFSEFTGGTVTFGDDGDYDNLNYTENSLSTTTDAVIGRQKGIDVVREMTEICMEFDDDCHPIENLAIELNSFKFSQNATYGDCAQACLLSLLRKMEVSPAMSDGRLVSLLKAKLDKFWTSMLQKLCRGVEEEVSILKALEQAATVDQQQQQQQQQQQPEASDPESIDALQTATEIAQKLRSGMAFRFFLQTLHDQEVLSEEAILQWAAEHRATGAYVEGDPKQAVFEMQSVQDFLEWLEEEEEDSSDDDSDDDDSDDDGSD